MNLPRRDWGFWIAVGMAAVILGILIVVIADSF